MRRIVPNEESSSSDPPPAVAAVELIGNENGTKLTVDIFQGHQEETAAQVLFNFHGSDFAQHTTGAHSVNLKYRVVLLKNQSTEILSGGWIDLGHLTLNASQVVLFSPKREEIDKFINNLRSIRLEFSIFEDPSVVTHYVSLNTLCDKYPSKIKNPFTGQVLGCTEE